jgi:hypothetical protein
MFTNAAFLSSGAKTDDPFNYLEIFEDERTIPSIIKGSSIKQRIKENG